MSGIRLCEKIAVKRTGLPVDSFAPLYDSDAARTLLSRPEGHTFVEFLHGDQATKFYFDTERYYESTPTPDQRDQYLADVHQAMKTVISVLYSIDHGVTYHLAQRHGVCEKRKLHKLSFRTFIDGVSVIYHHIPKIMQSVPPLREVWDQKDPDDNDFWDKSVYKAGEQLMCAIGGHKTHDDQRVLKPSPGHSDVLKYVISYVSPEWPDTLRCCQDELAADQEVPSYSYTDVKIAELIQLLGKDSASDRKKWINVAIFLKTIGSGSDAYLDDWIAFSKKGGAAFKSEEDCMQTWKSIRVGGGAGPGLTIGTIRHYAKSDDPTGYSEWCSSGSESTPGTSELINALRGIIPDLPNKVDLTPCKDGIKFKSDVSSGVIRRDSGYVYVDSGEYVGTLCPSFKVAKSLGFLHCNIDASHSQYDCNVHSGTDAKVTITHPNGRGAEVTVYNTGDINGKSAFAKINVTGQKEAHVRSKQVMSTLRGIINGGAGDAMREKLGPAVYALINNGTINIHLPPEKEVRRTDDGLVMAVIEYEPSLKHRIKFSPSSKTDNCNGLYVCDPETSIWNQRHNVVIEEKLVEAFGRMPNLTPDEKRHVESRRGRCDMVHLLAAKVIDEKFLDNLNANLDLLATANGVFDTSPDALSSNAGRPLFRAIKPEDCVSYTTGWAYDAESAKRYRPEVEDFLTKILPVEEEREVVIAFIATLFSGRRTLKKFLVLTDKRSGNNGKSSFHALVHRFLGDYYMNKGEKFVCRGTFESGRDSHDAGLESARGKRMIAAEELKKTMPLDESFLKGKSGGEDVIVEGRRFGKADQFRFVWQSAFMLIFNEGDCPEFDHEDSAFIGRMLVAPMRAKFVEAHLLPEKNDEEDQDDVDNKWTHQVDPTIIGRFPQWTSAFADILMERYGSRAFEKIPSSMNEWKHDVAARGNPITEWCTNTLEVTGNKKDILVLSDLRDDASRVCQLIRAFFSGVDGVKYVEKRSVKMSDGKVVTKRYVFTGLKLIAHART